MKVLLLLLPLLLVLLPAQVFAATFPSGPITYPATGEIAAEFWRWFIGIPVTDGHPYFDGTGELVEKHNQNTDVFFLVGTGSDKPVVRNVTIPHEKEILIPAHFAGYGYFPDVMQKAKDLVNIAIRPTLWFSSEQMVIDGLCIEACNHEITSLKVTLDGKPLAAEHVRHGLFKAYYTSNTPFFEGYHHAGAAKQDGTANSIVDGYFTLIEYLPPGNHVIHWEGKSAHYNDNVTYNVVVQ